MRWWFVVPWLALSIAVVRLAVVRRNTKAPYWWEPFDTSLPRGANLAIAAIAGAVAVFTFATDADPTLRVFVGGLLAAVCIPALVAGVVYRIELRAKGLTPLYKQDPNASSSESAGGRSS